MDRLTSRAGTLGKQPRAIMVAQGFGLFCDHLFKTKKQRIEIDRNEPRRADRSEREAVSAPARTEIPAAPGSRPDIHPKPLRLSGWYSVRDTPIPPPHSNWHSV